MGFDIGTARPVENGGFDLSTAQAATSQEDNRIPATDARIAQEAAYKGVAAIPDMLLNAPNNLINTAKSVYGLATRNPNIELKPNPDFTRRAMEKFMLIDPRIVPQGDTQRTIDLLTQGAVGGALTGGAGLAKSAIGAGAGVVSAGAAGATEALGGSPALQASAGMLPGAFGGRSSGKTPILKSKNEILNDTFERANAEGLKVPPSAMNPTWIGNRLEGVGGKAALGQQVAIENQPVVNKIARREAGLSPDEPISVKTLKAARDNISAPYREVEDLPGLHAKPVDAGDKSWDGSSFPMMSKTPQTPKELVRDWKSNNTRITELWNDYKVNHKVETLDAYKQARDKQESIEGNIEAAAVAAGRPDLIPQLRQARVDLAKNFTVERALNLGNGNVDAAVLGRMYDHGAKMTGGLETIAKFQQAFPASARESSRVPTPGVSKLEALSSVALGIGSHASGLGWFPMGLPMLSGPARSLALSPVGQGGRQFGPGPASNIAARVAPIATNEEQQNEQYRIPR